MVQVTKWLSDSCLHLNEKKTVCMFFTKVTTDATEPDGYVSGEKLQLVSDATEPDDYVSEENLQVVSDFKYLGIIFDSNLSFKNHVKRVI